jgi:hypothetical protein
MSESITHTAIVDDVARIAAYAPGICGPFKEVLAEHLDIARLGGITRHGDRHNPRLLHLYRSEWQEQHDEVAPKLAFVLGWMSHRAADRRMKKVFRELDSDCGMSPTDCSVYNDVICFREVYGAGENEPYLEGILGEAEAEVSAAEDMFHGMWRRMLIRMHTFKPGDDDIETWLDNVVKFQQEMRVDLRRYAKAFADPDPDKMRRFIEEPNFYDSDDDIIRLARSLQAGRPDESIDLETALAEADEDTGQASQYAQMIARAFGYVRASSEYWHFEIDMEELCGRLDIGLPELA